jgi:hypothetical protein
MLQIEEGIGLLLTRLIADTLMVVDPLDWPKGSTWLLERTDHRKVRGRLLAPLALSQVRIPEPQRLRGGGRITHNR